MSVWWAFDGLSTKLTGAWQGRKCTSCVYGVMAWTSLGKECPRRDIDRHTGTEIDLNEEYGGINPALYIMVYICCQDIKWNCKLPIHCPLIDFDDVTWRNLLCDSDVIYDVTDVMYIVCQLRNLLCRQHCAQHWGCFTWCCQCRIYCVTWLVMLPKQFR